MGKYVLAIDQGTTSSRAILFDRDLRIAAVGQREFPQHFPRSGWVEHDPEDLWNTAIATCKEAMAGAAARVDDIVAVGIANQRETAVVWERATGRPVYPAIVWQDHRTDAYCRRLKDEGAEPLIAARTGLLLDPYFSATEIAWILDSVEGARVKAEAGELAFGTVDSWLLWRMTGGLVHATDATNASRTLLYNIHEGCWDPDLLGLFRIPESLLPEVKDCAADFGMSEAGLFGRSLPILGIAGDQQAAALGQACFEPGMVKSTYGTGCFVLLNTGQIAVPSGNRLLTTVAYSLDGTATYALEGAIFVAGAVVQWLRDGLGLIESADETQALAEAADPNQEIYLVPAFTGLGAPYWDAKARGALFGITRATGPADLARAALESVGFQTRDLLEAMWRDWPQSAGSGTVLRVDGGMTASDWAMQFLSDMLGAPVDRPQIAETTALGAAWLAGMRAGFYPDAAAFAQTWALDRRFRQGLDREQRDRRYRGWKDAVRRTLVADPGA
ncbi:MAG: glycerol kinase GlpK [Rhodospirillales bacterium]|nr:glycerol kinase GlpK [Rhodospirillales bacterium]